MLLREFMKKYPDDSFDMMTPGGYVFLTPEQAKDLLAGKSVMAHPGDPACAVTVDAEELLSEPVESAHWENRVCHMLMGMPVEQGQTDDTEVRGMTEHEQERRLKERLKANYETYIQQLKSKPAPDLIEMASEIAAAKFIYEKLEVEGAFSECREYLLQFENPLEVLTDGWIRANSYDHQKQLERMLWNMAEKGVGVGEYPMMEETPAVPTLEQGVAMC